ncbi:MULTISPECIES: fused MFS/spermidine synthase [Paenibacillus]|uniref:Fused MFS/spermidine synthase n=1 Tax=Paenibacillus violae TaxID=3077234 RepID=A0ABU3R9N1_9BACL|nr:MULTISPECIES: fused MFS/spermidine synthase [Paenibacillus]MDU0200776.1 fused MFS/spermidine synthase [Paenibacillus sp. PFR10]MEC0267068.1 fused MFS/spermidine synthase [Paenibacillus anseongense]
MELLFKTSSPNHEISVYDTTELYGEKGRFRVLEFSNSAIQGAMDLNDPTRILFEYPRAIIHLIENNIPSLEKTFIIGHGIGTIAGYFSEKQCSVVEIDQTVVELSKKFFGYGGDNVRIGDGRQILANEKQHVYDAIVLDAFTEKGTPTHLISKQFFEICKEKLDPSGLIVMNLFGKGENDQLVNAIHSTLNEEFAYIKAFSLPSEDIADIQNFLLVGSQVPIRFQTRHMAGFTQIELGQGYIIQDKVDKSELN